MAITVGPDEFARGKIMFQQDIGAISAGQMLFPFELNLMKLDFQVVRLARPLSAVLVGVNHF